MSGGPNAFGLSRSGIALGNVTLEGDIVEGAFVATVGTLDGVTDGVALPNPIAPGDPAFLATGSLLYAGQFSSPDQIARLVLVTDNETSPELDERALLSHARLSVQNGDATGWFPLKRADLNSVTSLETNRALLVSPGGDEARTDAPGDNTQAAVTVSGASGTSVIVTSIDGVLIIPAAANQPAITLELVSNDGVTDSVLWSRQFGVGAAAGQTLTQAVSLSGLNIVVGDGNSAILRFSAASVATTLQSVAMTYHFVST